MAKENQAILHLGTQPQVNEILLAMLGSHHRSICVEDPPKYIADQKGMTPVQGVYITVADQEVASGFVNVRAFIEQLEYSRAEMKQVARAADCNRNDVREAVYKVPLRVALALAGA